jgi:hypothetical protein
MTEYDNPSFCKTAIDFDIPSHVTVGICAAVVEPMIFGPGIAPARFRTSWATSLRNGEHYRQILNLKN